MIHTISMIKGHAFHPKAKNSKTTGDITVTEKEIQFNNGSLNISIDLDKVHITKGGIQEKLIFLDYKFINLFSLNHF